MPNAQGQYVWPAKLYDQIKQRADAVGGVASATNFIGYGTSKQPACVGGFAIDLGIYNVPAEDGPSDPICSIASLDGFGYVENDAAVRSAINEYREQRGWPNHWSDFTAQQNAEYSAWERNGGRVPFDLFVKHANVIRGEE